MKCEMALNTAYGIDGMDGGSPILFQPNGIVKSSRQALEGFLSHLFLDVLSSLIVSDGVLMEYFLLRKSRAALCCFSVLTEVVLDGADDRGPVSRYARRRRFDCTCGETGIPCFTCPGQIVILMSYSFHFRPSSGSCDIVLGCDLCQGN